MLMANRIEKLQKVRNGHIDQVQQLEHQRVLAQENADRVVRLLLSAQNKVALTTENLTTADKGSSDLEKIEAKRGAIERLSKHIRDYYGYPVKNDGEATEIVFGLEKSLQALNNRWKETLRRLGRAQ